jgi:tetratricopeptide (TPR) repeat protein
MDLERRAEAAEEVDDFETALHLWRELVRKDRDPVFLCRYGRTAQKLENWDEAEKAFTDALRVDSKFSLALECMGSLWGTRTDRNDSERFAIARDWLLKALDLDRNARTLSLLGSTYSALGETENARHAYEEAARVDPNYEEAFYNLAQFHASNDLQKAVELLERAIQIDPDYGLAHQSLGRFYHRLRDFIRADYHYRRSLEIEPADYWSNLYLANFLGVQGKYDEAEEMYRRAMTLHPELDSSYTFYANFLESIGKSDEATGIRSKIRTSSEPQG